MAAVISDTGPLHYLILIGRETILHKLFERILLPEQVLTELRHTNTPKLVASWIGNMPDWIELAPSSPIPPDAPDTLGFGELGAIGLAESMQLPVLLDDLAARRYALALGVQIIGTLGILEVSAKRGWSDFAEDTTALRKLGFYASDKLVRQIIAGLESDDN